MQTAFALNPKKMEIKVVFNDNKIFKCKKNRPNNYEFSS